MEVYVASYDTKFITYKETVFDVVFMGSSRKKK